MTSSHFVLGFFLNARRLEAVGAAFGYFVDKTDFGSIKQCVGILHSTPMCLKRGRLFKEALIEQPSDMRQEAGEASSSIPEDQVQAVEADTGRPGTAVLIWGVTSIALPSTGRTVEQVEQYCTMTGKGTRQQPKSEDGALAVDSRDTGHGTHWLSREIWWGNSKSAIQQPANSTGTVKTCGLFGKLLWDLCFLLCRVFMLLLFGGYRFSNYGSLSGSAT